MNDERDERDDEDADLVMMTMSFCSTNELATRNYFSIR